MKERELSGWNGVVVWKDFKPSYVLEVVWAGYIQHMIFVCFTRQSYSGVENQNWYVHGFVTIHTDDSIMFLLHLFFYLLFCINISVYKLGQPIFMKNMNDSLLASLFLSVSPSIIYVPTDHEYKYQHKFIFVKLLNPVMKSN